jgi:flagellar basal-body rod protein FlgG
MIRGIDIASQGMIPLMDKQDQIANNLANINTTGFKGSGLFLKTYQKYLENDQRQPDATGEIKADAVHIDYSEGALNQTGSPLDLAIKGSGFFSIMTQDGVQYTRNGNFSLDPQGNLVTSDGSKVLGRQGYLQVDRQYPLSINENGELVQQGQVKGTLRIADFQKPYAMVRCGESRFKPVDPSQQEQGSSGCVVKEGYLEASNVSVVRNMVEMISSYRNFEADQKAVLAQDQTLEMAVTQVGKLS